MSGGTRSRVLGALGVAFVLAAAWLVLWTCFPAGDEEGPREGARPAAAAVEPAISSDGATPAAAPAPDASPPDPAHAIPPPVDLETADRERDLHGVVVDDDGGPVAGAALEVERRRPGRGWGDEPHLCPQPEPLRALSARDGTFRFPLDWGESVDLHVRAEGLGAGTFYDCLAGARLRVVLTRRPAAAVVLVRDATGAPVTGAKVDIWGSTVRPGLAPHFLGRADGEGRLVAEGLAPGAVHVTAEHPECGDCPDVDTFLPAGERVRIEVLLDRGRAVEGRVVDASTGLPIAGARIGRGIGFKRAVVSDAEGRFRFLGWNEVGGWGFGNLFCEARGYARAEARVPGEGPVEFRLGRGIRIEGRVVDGDGAPVGAAEATISGHQERGPGVTEPKSEWRRTATDAEGRFAFEEMLQDLPYRVSIRSPGHGTPSIAVPAPPEGVQSVSLGDVVLPEAHRLEGVVLDTEGMPVHHVEVHVGGARDVRVDDRGRFRVSDAAAGEQEVRVQRPDAFVLLESKVTVPEEGDLRDVVLRLPAFGRLRVRVTDPEGKPLRDVEVYAYGEEDSDWTRTDAEGRALLEHIKEAVVDVSAEAYTRGNRPVRLQAYLEKVKPEGQEIALVMENGVEISGVIRGPDGRPALHASVVATCEGLEDEWYSDRTGEGGGFVLRVREGLSYDLEATREDPGGNVIERAVLRQVSGPKEDVEIRLEPVKE